MREMGLRGVVLGRHVRTTVGGLPRGFQGVRWLKSHSSPPSHGRPAPPPSLPPLGQDLPAPPPRRSHLPPMRHISSYAAQMDQALPGARTRRTALAQQLPQAHPRTQTHRRLRGPCDGAAHEAQLGLHRIQAELQRLFGLRPSTRTIWKVLRSRNAPPLRKPWRPRRPHRYSRPIPGERVQVDTCKIASGLIQFTAVDPPRRDGRAARASGCSQHLWCWVSIPSATQFTARTSSSSASSRNSPFRCSGFNGNHR